MNSITVRRFQQAIINFTNESDLPIEVKRLCFINILNQIEVETNRMLNLEAAQEQQKGEAADAENLQQNQLEELSE